MTLKVECKVKLGRERKIRKVVRDAEPKAPVPRIAKLMALAIRFDQLIRDGVVKDQADLARLGHVSRARVTQIMNLLNLAPEIQEDLINAVGPGPSDRQLRPIVAIHCWRMQLTMFKCLSHLHGG
jgi:hypothetical protein